MRTRSAPAPRCSYVNYRDHTPLTGGQVDDTPFGGGAGMVLRVDVVEAALRARYGEDPVRAPRAQARRRADPGGRVLDDALVDELAAEPALTLLCGRYEGFDERVLEHFASDRVSIGRYVLAGGELRGDGRVRRGAAQAARVRSGDESSAVEESFSAALEGAPEYPHYTRPAEYRGWSVPEVLLSGHHARIREWRLQQSRARGDRTATIGRRAGGAGAVSAPVPRFGRRPTRPAFASS